MLLPGSTSFSGTIKIGTPSVSCAASNIPWLVRPINFLGFRFATITISFPTKSSGKYVFPMPATIWRSSCPIFICRTINFSDSGTRSALIILAIFSSTCLNSSIVMMKIMSWFCSLVNVELRSRFIVKLYWINYFLG